MNARRARVCVVVMLFATAFPLGASAAGGACPTRVTEQKNGWWRIAPPAFTAGPATLSGYAVAPHNRDLLFATNGVAVARSGDGGCTWTPGFVLPEQPSAEVPVSRDSAAILDVVVGKVRSYLLLRDKTGPRVATSSDGGATWSFAVLPALSPDVETDPPTLVADNTGMTAYLLAQAAPRIDLISAGGTVLVTTTDGGATWAATPVSAGGELTPGRANDVAVDPVTGTDVWVTTAYGLLRSDDGGQTWSNEPLDDPQSFGQVTVTHRGDAVQVVVTSETQPVLYISKPGGWTTVNTPGPVSSLAGGPSATQLAIIVAGVVHELNYRSLTWHHTHDGDPVLSQLDTDYTGRPAFHACACTSPEPGIWTRMPPRATDDLGRDVDRDRAPVLGGFPGYYGCAPDPEMQADPAEFPESLVRAAKPEIEVLPGQSVTVPYEFVVRPREVDLYFLFDSGPRSTYFGCAAKQGAVWAAAELSRRRNVRVGAGEYRDFPGAVNPWLLLGANCLTSAKDEFVYRRNVRIGPVDEAFRKGVGRVSLGDCTGDFAGLAGLYQAATGAGQDLPPAGASPYDMRARQYAGFAPDSLKVIVHITGGWMATSKRISGYPGPDFEETIEALAARGIRQIGIHTPVDHKKHHDGRQLREYDVAEDLSRVAAGTGAVAERPVTCDRATNSRLRVGQPLVCVYVEESASRNVPPIGRQVVELVNAMTDVQQVRFAVLDGAATVAQLSPRAPRRIDHLVTQKLNYSVTFSCTPDQLGTVQQVQLGGLVGSRVVARTTTTVRCGAPPVPPPPDDPLPNIPIVVAPIAQAAAPPANPILQPNPATNPASQANAQAQHLAQGAAVPQEEQQAQLAYVHANPPQRQVGEQLAMSALPRRREPQVPAWALVNAFGVTAGAAAALAVQRQRSQAAVALSRRRRR